MWCLIRRANSSPHAWATRSWWMPSSTPSAARRCGGRDWHEIAMKLSQYSQWEFEDYGPGPGTQALTANLALLRRCGSHL